MNRRHLLVCLGTGAVQIAVGAHARSTGLTKANVRDFGAKGDGKTDDAPAIAAAIASLAVGGTIEFPAGRYYLKSELAISGKSGLTFSGQDATITGSRVPSYFRFSDCKDINIAGLEFDCSHNLLPVYENYSIGPTQIAIFFISGVNLNIIGCRFVNLYTSYIFFKNSSGLAVLSCSFFSPLQQQDQYLSFVEILTVGGEIDVSRNKFYGSPTTRNDRSPCAVTASGVRESLRITENHAEHCGRNNAGGHRLGVFDIYADAQNVEIAHNVAINCREQFLRLSTTIDASVHHNTVRVAAEADPGYSTITIESGSFPNVLQPVSRRIALHCNDLADPNHRHAFAIGVLAYDWGAANEAVNIVNNRIAGHDVAIVVAGPFDGLTIAENQVHDVRAFIAQSLVSSVPMTSVLGQEGSAIYVNLTVQNNWVKIRKGSPSVPISLSTYHAPPFSGRVGPFHVNENAIAGERAGTEIAISVICNTSVPQGQLVATGNRIAGYRTPFYLRSLKQARLHDNSFADPVMAYVTDGSVGRIDAVSNGYVAGLDQRIRETFAIKLQELACHFD